MKLTADDYRRHYRGLSDEELLNLDPRELVDIARRCYDAELERRHLEAGDLPPEPEFEPPETPGRTSAPGDMVQVGVLSNVQGAMYAQTLLRDADIPAELTNQPSVSGFPTGGYIGVMVPASCVEAARDLLAGVLARDNQLLVRRWLEKEWEPEGVELTGFAVTIDDLFGEEDKVAVRFTAEGVDAHSGKHARYGGLAIVRVADGKIAESWINLDR